MTSTVIGTIIGAIFGSNALFGLITFLISRHDRQRDDKEERDDKILKTLAAVSYTALSDNIEKRLDDGYATPEQRKELDILYEAYKANGWNGDMETRMAKVYALPTKKLNKDSNWKLP